MSYYFLNKRDEMRLSLHTTASITASEAFHFICRNKIEVSGNGMFKRRCSYCKFQGLRLGGLCKQPMN